MRERRLGDVAALQCRMVNFECRIHILISQTPHSLFTIHYSKFTILRLGLPRDRSVPRPSKRVEIGSVDTPVHSGGCVKQAVLLGIWSLKLRVYPPWFLEFRT
jgi:hypothetical protein